MQMTSGRVFLLVIISVALRDGPKPFYDFCHWSSPSLMTYSNFDDGMKLADITPVHKKDDVTNKFNYCTIRGLLSGSKLFERIIQNQIVIYIETCLNPYICGYRKGYNVQHALNALIERWCVSLDNKVR